jgi:phosphate transport system substrate-binding protein
VGVIPGTTEYFAEFSSDKAWGDEGCHAEKGLISMPEHERSKVAADAGALTSL